ncbi:VOC family protein [Streptomyces sp. x-80]|uniref:VOC family protein n=1 Tax=Streptomyces sp. x-80 TaxID=2789282 RepID=UPI00398115C3
MPGRAVRGGRKAALTPFFLLALLVTVAPNLRKSFTSGPCGDAPISSSALWSSTRRGTVGVGLKTVVIKASDPIYLGRFWSAVLESPIGPGRDGVYIKFGGNEDTFLYIMECPDGERAERTPFIHLRAENATLTEEVERLTGLGATFLAKKWTADEELNVGWAVMADPGGNVFHIESSDQEVAAAEALLESWE